MSWLALFLLLQAPQVLDRPNEEKNPFDTPADRAWGKKLFAGRCAGCHGPLGDGGKGANLGVPQLPRAGDDRTLYRVIRYGLPDTEMPSTLLSPKEVWQVAAFVRTLGRVPKEKGQGNAANGKALVRGKGGCLQCHSFGTEGGQLGPPLGEIGARRSAKHLRAKLLSPESNVPEHFRMVEVTTRGGRRISGVRLNEDTWTLQIRDGSHRFHSFEKKDLTALKVERRTIMPSYRERLTAREVDDVVAYLSGLRSEP
ncbi:MAG: c-type cytochrome [Bryobacteraceae bacterium]